MKSVIFDDGDTLLNDGDNIFTDDENLESIYLGRNLSRGLDLSDWHRNYSLKKLIIGSSVTCINSILERCYNLKELVFIDGEKQLKLEQYVWEYSEIETVYLGRDLVGATSYLCSEKTIKNLTIGSKVTFIAGSILNCCDSTSEIIVKGVVPPNLYSGYMSDFNIFNTAKLKIPEDAIGYYLCSEWSRFTNIVVDNVNNSPITTYTDDGLQYRLFSDQNKVKNIAFLTGCNDKSQPEIHIPDKIAVNIDEDNANSYDIIGIGFDAFGEYSDYISSEVKNVTFEDSSKVKYIGDYAFYGANNLSLFEMPDSVETIGRFAFSGCWHLKVVKIPSKIKTLGGNIWTYSHVEKVIYNVITPISAETNNFDTEDYESAVLFVPFGNIQAFKALEPWSSFSRIAEISLILNKNKIVLKATQTDEILVAFSPEETFDGSVEWTTSNESVATVDCEGKVTAVAPGEAVITATCGYVSATCTVTVVPTQAENITLSQEAATLDVGETVELTATVVPNDVTDKTITWGSSNEDVATVDQDGMVEALAVGEAVITATAHNGISASCRVTVKPVLAESLTISPESWKGMDCESFQITAIVIPDNTTDKSLTWRSSDVTVATVDDCGLVSVLRDGMCRIIVATVDGSNLTSECVITSFSGVESILADDTKVDVYNVQGILLKRQCDKDALKSLVPGVYVVRSNRGSKIILFNNANVR